MTDGRRGPLILALHGIENVPVRDDPQRLFVAPSAMNRIIERLKDRGYSFATFADLARAIDGGRAQGLVALTFDDGYRNNLYELVPILQRHEITATVFVVSGWLGGTHPDHPQRPMLSPDEVRILSREGVQIGCHTATHRDLTTLEQDEAERDLLAGRRALEDMTELTVDVAAYPFGNATEATIAACRAAGFFAACRTSGRGSWSDLLNLPREDIGNHPTMLGLELKRRGYYEPLMRTLPGRVARRALYAMQKRVS